MAQFSFARTLNVPQALALVLPPSFLELPESTLKVLATALLLTAAAPLTQNPSQPQSQPQTQPQTQAPIPPPAQTCPQPTHISIQSGTFSSQPGVSFGLTRFVATLVPRTKTLPSCLDKDTLMTRGEIFVSNKSITEVFAAKLVDSASKIKDFKVQNGVGHVTLSGHVTRLVPLSFSVDGPVTTDGTSLLLDASTIKADGIPVKALLGLVGEHLSAVLKMNGVAGVTVNGNQLVFSPEQIAHLKGHIASVETNDQGITLRYSAPRRKPAAR